MTIRTTFFALFCLLANCLMAQHKQLDQRIGWPGGQIALQTICNKAKKQACTFVLNEENIRAFLLTSQVQIQKEFDVPREKKEELLGGFIKEGKIYLFMQNKKNDGLHNRVLDIAGGGATAYNLPFDVNDEKIVDRISCDDHFLYFTVNKQSSEFIIYDFTSEREYSTLRYKFGEGVWKDLTKQAGTKRIINVETVDVEGDCNLEIAAKRNKVYINNDILYLLMNNDKGSTRVFSFDLKNKKADARVIEHMSTPDASLAENSFLLQNKLFYVGATKDTLCIQVIDIASGAIVKSFGSQKDEDIAFKNTPIIEEGHSESYNQGLFKQDRGSYPDHKYDQTQRDVGTAKLLRKMVNSKAVIVATRNENNNIELVVGAYKSYSTSMPSSSSYGPQTTNTSWYAPVGGMSRNTFKGSTHFKMLLNASSNEHIEGDMRNSINERIENYTSRMKIPAEAENLFSINGIYYYAYYDREERKLVILKF
jgi:hypothetical protein